MKVQAQIDGDETIAMAARGDYMYEWYGDKTYEEIMAVVKPKPEDWHLAHMLEWDSAVQAAEVFNYVQPPEKVVETTAKTCRLLRRLVRADHWGPFEHGSLTLSFTGISRACATQARTHRHASFDQQSMRYTVPDRDIIFEIADGVRDISEMENHVVVPPSLPDDLVEFYLQVQLDSFIDYFTLYDSIPGGQKLKAQDARSVLPQYTKVNNFTVTANPRSWMHIRCMRGAADAQWEIREMSDLMWEEFSYKYPITAALFEEEGVSERPHKLAP